MLRPTVDQRVVAGQAATLEVEWTDEDGEATTAAEPVTLHVVAADGTEVVAAGTATTADPARTGVYQHTVAAALLPDVNLLTATWTDTAGAKATTLIDVAGGWWFSLRQAREQELVLKDTTKYPSSKLRRVRLEVEDEAEWIMDRAMVRRYGRMTLPGTGDGTLHLGVADMRTDLDPHPIVAVTVGTTPFTDAELAELTVDADGMLRRPIGKLFQLGVDNVTVGFRYGQHQPPNDLRRAAILRLRQRCNADKSGIPDRATTMSNEFGTFQLAGEQAYSTGSSAVDGPYHRYSRRAVHGAPGAPDEHVVPASATFDYDPTRGSLFHGGRR